MEECQQSIILAISAEMTAFCIFTATESLTYSNVLHEKLVKI